MPDASAENEPPPNSQSSTKENDAPNDAVFKTPPVPAYRASRTPQPVQPPDTIATQEGTLPPDLLSSYQSSTRILESDFSLSPPYTIQRLAELVLYPKRHYRFLPAYLRALDRVVSVSSPVSDFPLPTLSASTNGGFLTNGDTGGAQTNGITEREGLGSDESLGGALLTPIPWLRSSNNTSNGSNSERGDGEMQSESTETIEGPHGPGGIETVSVTVNGVPSATSAAHTDPTPASPTLSEQSDASTGSSVNSTEQQLREQGGVTQGELLRQEQEAGVVPVAQTSPRRTLLSSGAVAVGRQPLGDAGIPTGELPPGEGEERPEERPHARGPDLIGMEDMGPQQHSLGTGHLDMEAAVGRSRSPQPPMSPPSQALRSVEAEKQAEEAAKDDAGKPGQDQGDVEKDVEQLREGMEDDIKEEAKDADGDVVVTDADGRDVEGVEKAEITGDLSGADAADTTTL